MEAIKLQLFDQNTFVPESLVKPKKVVLPEEKQPTNPLKSLEQTLSTIFPTNQEENKTHKARAILGETARDFTDEQLGYLVTDFEYLIDSWLDLFEKKAFGGKTLREFLGESANGNTK